MDDFLQKYGAYALMILTAVGGWVFGLRKNQWEIMQFKDELIALKTRVEHLETQGSAGAATLAGIAATLGAIQETLREIKSELRGKADKP